MKDRRQFKLLRFRKKISYYSLLDAEFIFQTTQSQIGLPENGQNVNFRTNFIVLNFHKKRTFVILNFIEILQI